MSSVSIFTYRIVFVSIFIFTPASDSLFFTTPLYGGAPGSNNPSSFQLSQTKIIGVSSWGSIVNYDLWPTFDNAVGKLKAISEEGTSQVTVGYGGGSLAFSLCTPFSVNIDAYITGYRIVYNAKYVFGLYFYSSDNVVYDCIASDLNLNNYIDSGIVMHNDYYLSGFSCYYGSIMDSISFEFTQISDSTTDEPFSTTFEPINVPTNKPTNKPTNEPTNEQTHEPTNDPTNEPTKQPVDELNTEPTNTTASLSPTAVFGEQEVMDTTDSYDNSVAQNESQQSKQYSINYLSPIFIAVAVSLFLVCLVAIGGILYYARIASKPTVYQQAQRMISMERNNASEQHSVITKDEVNKSKQRMNDVTQSEKGEAYTDVKDAIADDNDVTKGENVLNMDDDEFEVIGDDEEYHTAGMITNAGSIVGGEAEGVAAVDSNK